MKGDFVAEPKVVMTWIFDVVKTVWDAGATATDNVFIPPAENPPQ